MADNRLWAKRFDPKVLRYRASRATRTATGHQHGLAARTATGNTDCPGQPEVLRYRAEGRNHDLGRMPPLWTAEWLRLSFGNVAVCACMINTVGPFAPHAIFCRRDGEATQLNILSLISALVNKSA